MGKVAVAADIPSYKLSELLNNYYEKNFNAYINTWRINYITDRLAEGAHKTHTLEALATEAGFASRRSFFTAFKKEKDLSPTAYIATMDVGQLL